MRSLLVTLLSVVLAACGNSDPRQVRLELLTRSSCGSSTATYDISCVQALEVGLLTADGTRYRSQCTVVGGRYESVQDLVAEVNVVELLQDVRARENARVEVRAYHAFDSAPCQDPGSSQLMLWGASDFVDLSDPTLLVLTVPLECRPECDCQDFDDKPAECPAALVQGVCAPAPTFHCRKPCEDDSSCYGGTLTCETSTCGPIPAPACCASPEGGMCWECAQDSECDSNQCVHNVQTNEYFCAQLCPSLESGPDYVAPCPTHMACRRLGNGIFE